jgi:hypothetical protein
MEDFRLDSWPMLLGFLWPALGWLLSLLFYGFVAALGFLGHKHTASRGWMFLGFGAATAFVGTLPTVFPFMMMFAASMSNYIGLLSVALGIIGLLKLAAGILFAIGLFLLYKENRGAFRRAP